ncbi:hypothetical protein AB0M50_16985 [Nonomuraea fuscirosea]|uniref:hypothetical protein n=1 Tax=Nonomuraea fuscirosea TaxID=1291556 RepID=UPI002DD832B2|nr:hypothetical protein [Nonomuraea fuscirosea]WSA49430.1 hypothetical protein OIE67_35900 [Nonomuraea fuscirosea]
MSSTVDVDKREQASSAKRAQGVEASTKIWHTLNFPDATQAAAWVNRAPAQGAGEAAFSTRGNGSVDVYYFM